MESILLYQKIANLPDSLKRELSDFVDFLKTKMKTPKPSKKPKFGVCNGQFKMSDDFNEPLSNFEDYQ